MTSSERVTFQRFGRAYHLRIQNEDDLLKAVDLDEAHWVATSAPIDTIRCDSAFLRLLDRDGDGRIHSSDVKQAIRWLFDHVADKTGVSQRSRSIRLDSVNASGPDGGHIRTALSKMLMRLSRSENEAIELGEIRDFKAKVESMPVSDAGVVLPEATGDGGTRQFIKDILGTIGGVRHPSGNEGVAQEQLDRFLTEAKAYLEWNAQGCISEEESGSAIMPFGNETNAAYSALSELRSKIDQYFAQCSVVALDGRLVGRMPPREGELEETNFGDPDAIATFMKDAPLAPPSEQWILDLKGPINPYYAERLGQLREKVFGRILGRKVDRLSQLDWRKAKDHFAGHEEWLEAKPKTPVESLGIEKLREYLGGTEADEVGNLIAQSKETALQLDNIRLAEKLVLDQAYLLDLANNFVSFPHLYDPQSRAMFEMGSLVMDGRRFNLAVRVQNRAEHEAVAKTSDIFVLYLQVAADGNKQPYEVAVPVTSGGRGNLVVGKRGIFQDIQGNEWDARVVQIIQNPISLSEAIVAPFKRIGALITGKIEQLTAAGEKKLDTTTQQTFTQVETAVTAGEPAVAPAPPIQQAATNRGLLAGGILAGGGVAVAALTSALAYISKVVAEHNFWILAGIGGAILAVLLPSVILAAMKLRRRDLSAILEGSGWAINARMRLSRAQRKYFSQHPRYPLGAKGLAFFQR